MFANILTYVFPAFCAFFCALCVFLTTKRYRVSRIYKELAEVQLEITDVGQSLDSLRKSHRRLNSKIAMREKRHADKQQESPVPDSLPDPTSDPVAWKQAMRREIHLKGVK